jgi:hypothetical protein
MSLEQISRTCSKCGSDRVIPRTRVIDHAHYGADAGNVQVGSE